MTMPRKRRKSGRRDGVTRRAARYLAESLEVRRLLTITVSGTINDDTIVVTRSGSDLHVNLNGSNSTIGIGSEINLVVFGSSGNDTITVDNVDMLLTVNGSTGNDSITVGGGDIQNGGDARVFGGSGTDIVIMNDSGSAGADSYDLRADITNGGTLLFKNGGAFPDMILDDTIESIRLLANASDNAITVQDRVQNAVSSYDIQGNGGNDTCEFDNVQTASSFNFNGNAGTNTLIYSQQPGVGTTFTINFHDMDYGANSLTWLNASQLEFHGTILADTFNIDVLGNGVSLEVLGEDGDDSYNVGNGEINGNIFGTLTIMEFNGRGEGTDRVFYNDSVATGNYSYTVQNGTNSLAKTGLNVPITAFVESYTLTAGDGANTITAIPEGVINNNWAIHGGSGNDSITFGDGIIRGLQGNVTLSGGGGTDNLVIDDGAGDSTIVSDKDYAIHSGKIDTFVNGGAGFTINYSTVETVTLEAGPLANDFTLDTGLGGENTLNLVGGNGNDTLLVEPFTTTSTITFDGQGATDSITIDDTGDTLSGSKTYTMTQNSFDETGFGLFTYSAVESLLVKPTNAADTININGVGFNVPTTVQGGSSPDTFNVGNGDLDTNIAANLYIEGNQGGDTLILNDTTDAGDDSYTISGGSVTKSSWARSAGYGTLEHVQLNGSPGNNLLNFVSPGFALDVTLRGFAGSDTFQITPSATATVSVEGSDPTIAPGDVLQFVNAAAAGSATLTPNGAVNGTYAFASAKSVTFTGMETFPSVPSAPSSPDLATADDTGINSGDNVTKKTSALFSGKGAANVTIQLKSGATVLGTTTLSAAGSYSITGAFAADGNYPLQAIAMDPTSGLTSPASGTLNVTIDTVAPAAPSAAPDLADGSDSGISNIDNITNVNTPTFNGLTSAGNIVRLRADGGQVGMDISTSTGDYSITLGAQLDATHIYQVTFEDLAGNVTAASPGVSVTIDTTAPLVSSSEFNFTKGQSVRFAFNENVGPTLSVGDLTLANLTNSTAIPAGSMALVFAGNAGTFSFPGLSHGTLPDGNYQATLGGAGISDLAGNAMTSDPSLSFFVLAGDANRDRSVDAKDLGIFSLHWQSTSSIFTDGDFNYDSNVDLNDLYILSVNWRHSLPPAATPVSVAITPRRTPRIAAFVI
jgi:hypothetical protein